MNTWKRIGLLAFVVGMTMLMASPAGAAATQIFTFTNNGVAAASDLHVTFTGTGGNITVDVLINPFGCPAPTDNTAGNTMNLDWGAACVDPGEFVTVRVTTPEVGPIKVDSGEWTPTGTPVNPPDIWANQAIPSLTQWGMIGLVVLMLAAGAVMIVRKRRVAPNV